MAAPVLDRGQLEESPLADLHALAAEVGIENFRRMRREELVSALLGGASAGDAGGGEAVDAADAEPAHEPRTRARRTRTRRPRAEDSGSADDDEEERPSRPARSRGGREEGDRPARRERATRDRPPREGRGRPAREEEPDEDEAPDGSEEERTGVLEILGNGSGFLRSDPFRQSEDDVYVAPAQIRRCELRSGDEISGPVRPPRRNERHPSLARVDTVNGGPAEPPAERPRFDDLTAGFASERLPAPEGLERAPYGRGSRVSVAGPPGSGVTTLLRRMVSALGEGGSEVELVVVLAGTRPEETAEWRAQDAVTVVGGAFDVPHDERTQGAEAALERAKRSVERGGHAALFVEGLDALPEGLRRRVFGAARRTEEGGTLTVVASSVSADLVRYATTRIVLEPPGEGAGGPVLSEASLTLRADALA